MIGFESRVHYANRLPLAVYPAVQNAGAPEPGRSSPGRRAAPQPGKPPRSTGRPPGRRSPPPVSRRQHIDAAVAGDAARAQTCQPALHRVLVRPYRFFNGLKCLLPRLQDDRFERCPAWSNSDVVESARRTCDSAICRDSALAASTCCRIPACGWFFRTTKTGSQPRTALEPSPADRSSGSRSLGRR